MSNEELEKKAITFDQICESQDFDHNEKFVLLLYANKEIERLKAEIESHNKKYENLYKSYCSICREKEGLKDYAAILIDKEKKENQQLKEILRDCKNHLSPELYNRFVYFKISGKIEKALEEK